MAFPVQVPENCPYFPYGEAYVPLITRVAEEGPSSPGGMRGTGIAEKHEGTARGSSPCLGDATTRKAEGGEEASPSERKRRKRKALEALVRESLGL